MLERGDFVSNTKVEDVIEKFIRYTKFDTQSDANTGASPAQKQRTPKPNHELNKTEHVLNQRVVGCFVMKRKLTHTKVKFIHSIIHLRAFS